MDRLNPYHHGESVSKNGRVISGPLEERSSSYAMEQISSDDCSIEPNSMGGVSIRPIGDWVQIDDMTGGCYVGLSSTGIEVGKL